MAPCWSIPTARAAGCGHGPPPWSRVREELSRSEAPATSAERIESALGRSPFAPLYIVEVAGPAEQLPFSQPYVFGDTRLSRLHQGRVFCTSIPGIAHGSASSSAWSRMLAWSEGAERLAAQGARPQLLLSTEDERARAAYRLFGEAPPSGGERAFCHGLDLLHGGECLVPFERVAVAVPAALMPGGVPAESTFTGCASHVTARAAILHGSVELLKRDAYVATWYRKRRLAPIVWPRQLPPELAERTRYLQRHGIELRLYDLRAELPLPMVLLHARAERRVGHWPAGGSLLVPAGGFTALSALGHALALVSSRFVGLAFEASAERDPLDPAAVQQLGRTLGFWPGLARYLDPAHAGALEFIASGDSTALESLDVALLGDPLQALRKWLGAAGLSWLAVPLSEPAARQAGLTVIKAIVPQALRITVSGEPPDRSHPRLARSLPGAPPGSWNDQPLPLY